MGSKEKLAELVAGLTEWQAGPLLVMSQAYLQGVKDSETKGRLDISNEVIKYLSDSAPPSGYEARGPMPVRPAITPVPPPTRG